METLTLDKLVRELLIESGEQTTHKYATYLQHGLSGLRELNMDVSGIPKIVRMEVGDNDLANLPNDYISHIRIAVCGVDGNLHFLGFNRDLCFPLNTDDCGEIIPNGGTPGSAIIANVEGGNYRNSEQLGRRFGLGGGNNANGFYRIDERKGLIAFQGLAGDMVILEYLADIDLNDDGDFNVHPYLIEAVKNWIFWKIQARNARIPANQTLLAKQDYRASMKIAKRRMSNFTVEEAMQSIRKSFTPSPKM